MIHTIKLLNTGDHAPSVAILKEKTKHSLRVSQYLKYAFSMRVYGQMFNYNDNIDLVKCKLCLFIINQVYLEMKMHTK